METVINHKLSVVITHQVINSKNHNTKMPDILLNDITEDEK